MIVVLAEKPSVARDLAAVLGARARREGYFEGAGYRVTWAIGHLVGLAQPHEIDPGWKTWSYATLPMLPERFPLVVLDDGRAQYRIVERLLRDADTSSVVAATDAGREGELIFRYIYERAGCKKPWQRLWISSLTQDAIRQAFAQLQPGARYDGLAAAAKARSRADWLVGMNLSRAYTLSNGTLFSVGRVQTPTLAMVVQRDREIRAFVPEHYLEVEATFESDKGRYRGTYHPRPAEGLRSVRGKLVVPKPELARLPIDGHEAEAICQRAREGQARVAAVERSLRRTPPPLLYDLTELQRHANRLYGFTAKQTLDTAQALYERHKLLSYPRTDSRHLTRDIAATLPDVVRAIAPGYAGLVAADSGKRALGPRFVDDAKVADHHALIPTSEVARLTPGSREARIYDLVCRRLLMAWHPDLVESLTTVFTEITPSGGGDPIDLYISRGSSVEAPGWTVLDPRSQRKELAPTIPGGLAEGDDPRVVDVVAQHKQTQPPRPFSEATLLTAMETAGRTLDDKTLLDALRESGLGTPATRAATIETLLARSYLIRDGKNLCATPSGEALIDAVHAQVKSAAMTGSWELRLRKMERGEDALTSFMRAIESYVREVVSEVSTRPQPNPPPPDPAPLRKLTLARNVVPARNTSARRNGELARTGAAPRGRAASPRPAATLAAPASRYEVTPAGAVLTQLVSRDATRLAGSPEPAMPAGAVLTQLVSRDATRLAGSPEPASAALTKPPRPLPASLDRSPGSDVPVSAKPIRRSERHASSPATRAAEPRALSSELPANAAGDLAELLQARFGHARFRPHQEEVCRAVREGRDVLLVMPTGAGKSLCYQLPGLARAGTTLVVSPLIALIDDQCAKLAQLGLRAERIHSGRDRATSREICARYLAGELDFLFIAPERLGVAGFPALLAKRPPALIAIDEAHCISQWGHDFRPDYRMLRERLSGLRPSPIIALTATATPIVQRDILEQLAVPSAQTFILGFRRSNLAIEAVALPKNRRSAFSRACLQQPGRLPAIIYAPTRKDTEQLAAALRGGLRVAAYHAGMASEARAAVQTRFLSGKLDCIVATIAFGMGIDKHDVRTVIHTAQPSSLESYYQEIGRAGRDGAASRAILLHGPTDRRTHDFFLERDYPPATDLTRLHNLLSNTAQTRDSLAARMRKAGPRFDTILEKLWIHGGAVLAADGGVTRAGGDYRSGYASQRAHRVRQLDDVADFLRSRSCRMGSLVHHFGDMADAGTPCGICDICAPDDALEAAIDTDGLERTASKRPARKRKTWSPGRSRRSRSRSRSRK